MLNVCVCVPYCSRITELWVQPQIVMFPSKEVSIKKRKKSKTSLHGQKEGITPRILTIYLLKLEND